MPLATVHPDLPNIHRPSDCMSSGTMAKKVGDELNYDEVVVYNEDAALPTYLISYSFY